MPASDEEETSQESRQPCAFFLKTGSCAFGDQCKFEHPADQPPPQYNSLGLPLRPGEPECAYYAKNLHCGYGASCKFHHSEPALSWVPVPVMDTYAMRPRSGFSSLHPFHQSEGISGVSPSYPGSMGSDPMLMSAQPMIRAQSFGSSQSQSSGRSYFQQYAQPHGYAAAQPYGVAVIPQPAYSQQLANLQIPYPGMSSSVQSMQSPMYQHTRFVPQLQNMMQPRFMNPAGSGQSVEHLAPTAYASIQQMAVPRPSSTATGHRQPATEALQAAPAAQSQQSATRSSRTGTSSGGPSRSRLDRTKEAKS